MHDSTFIDSPTFRKPAPHLRSVEASLASEDSNPIALPLDLPPELAEAVALAVEEAFSKPFTTDELLGEPLTAVCRSLDSLCKRHGLLIELAVAHALAAQERYEVSTQVSVPISKAALALVDANPIRSLEGLNLPSSDGAAKTVVIDVLAFDWTTGTLHVVSVKRGGGPQGGKAARDARRDLTAAGLMLKLLMARQGFPVQAVSNVLIDWYGRSGIIARKTVSRETIDGHFGVSVRAIVEAMTRRMEHGIADRMAPLLLKALGREVAGLQVHDQTEAGGNDPLGSSKVEPRSTTPRPSLAACLSVLPARRQGRQMSVFGA